MFHPESIESAKRAGHDAGFYGPNISNCRFALFAVPELTAAWQLGNVQGQEDRKKHIAAIAAAEK